MFYGPYTANWEIFARTLFNVEIKRNDFAHTFIPENNLLKQIECHKFNSLSASAALKTV